MLIGTLCLEPTNTSVGWAGIIIGWNPDRRFCYGWQVPEEDPILDAGSGPQPVALLLVIGKLLGGAGALLALDKADHHTGDRGVTLNVKTMRRDFEYNTYSPTFKRACSIPNVPRNHAVTCSNLH